MVGDRRRVASDRETEDAIAVNVDRHERFLCFPMAYFFTPVHVFSTKTGTITVPTPREGTRCRENALRQPRSGCQSLDTYRKRTLPRKHKRAAPRAVFIQRCLTFSSLTSVTPSTYYVFYTANSHPISSVNATAANAATAGAAVVHAFVR